MSRSRQPYSVLKEKTFENALTRLFQTEFGFLGGPAVIRLMVNRITALIDEYHPKAERMHFGELLWFAVDENEKRGHQRGMKHLKLKPVILPLVTPSDIEDYINNVPQRTIAKNVMARLFKASYAQGGILAEHDVAIILHRDRRKICRYFIEHQKETNEPLPSRGVIHDIGSGTTHKEIIVSKYLIEGKESPKISREVNHSVRASDRYIKAANQVRVAIKNGVPTEEIHQVTGMSKRLVEIYIELLNKIATQKQAQKGG